VIVAIREDWFNRPHLKFLHGAYVLAEFVGLIPVERVRLASASEQWPDGYVKLSGKTHNIEVTMPSAVTSICRHFVASFNGVSPEGEMSLRTSLARLRCPLPI
jgi:hypothetical protein